MNRRPEPPDQPDRRTTPVPPRPDWRRTQPAPRRPVPPPPPRPPARPPAQPWYLEFRRPPVPPSTPPQVPPADPPKSAVPKSAAPQPHSNRGLLIGAGLSVLLVFAVLGTLMLGGLIGGSGPVELDVTHAQDGVRQVLTDPIDGYGRENVGDIHCNNGVNPKVHKGRSFSCVVTVDGAQRQVLVEFADDAGTYAVDRPR